MTETLEFCALVGIECTAVVALRPCLRLGDPLAEQMLADTDLLRDVRDRPSGLEHQAGGLFPALRGV